MDKSFLVKLLNGLRIEDLSTNNSNESFGEKCLNISRVLDEFQKIDVCYQQVTKHYFSDPKISEWQYLIYNFYTIRKIGEVLEADSNTAELLSVKEMKDIKMAISDLIKLGIQTKLQPKVPFQINEIYTKTNDIFFQYNILKCTLLSFCDFLNNDSLRVLILPQSLRVILTGLYQIGYCPLKPRSDLKIPEDTYKQLIAEKEMALTLLRKLRESIHPAIYVKETMIIPQHDAPKWFKKALSMNLSNIMHSSNGVEKIVVAILDGSANDKTKTWGALDIIFRLIFSCKDRPDFKSICQQVVQLVNKSNEENEGSVYERVFITCTKNFFHCGEEELSKEVFISNALKVLLRFTFKDYKVQEGVFTKDLKKHIRLVHAIFVENNTESSSLPVILLKPVLEVLFKIYMVTMRSVFITTHTESKEILLKFITEQTKYDNVVFDAFLFGICSDKDILPFKRNIILDIEGQDILVKVTEHTSTSSTSTNSEGILELLHKKPHLLSRFFKYLLRCLANKEKYFTRSNEALLHVENELMNENIERQLVVFNDLSILAEDERIQNQIIESPNDIINFIKEVLDNAIEMGIHKSANLESQEFQSCFTVIMILNALITNYSRKKLRMFKILSEPLNLIKSESKHLELLDLVDKALYSIEVGETAGPKINTDKHKSEFDIILEDICDPLLPVRAHGIMALKKLVEAKHTSVMDKKQYILTIFQQNLKNEDSFIYLNAVDGLASMCSSFTDTVINTLCEEYSAFDRKEDDGHEVRIKLGEVLVRVTKSLGEMAPKYKAVLLNTFLVGTRDDDQLVRASSLSNLGEICRVLGFKLGTVISEVLVCVHAIITMDKAIEPRRAAVTVLRQLLTGLENETIVFLKEDILPVYRSLKEIYYNDKDDIMRLQAQLALEELNENMKQIVFPKPQLSMQKNIVLLN